LLKTPSAVRFVSYEPALGPVDFTDIRYLDDDLDECELTALDGVIKLDWIIAGGESGPNARPPRPGWFRSVGHQCADAGVPFFFKQWGEWAPRKHFDNFEAWNAAASHALVSPAGSFSEKHGPDRPDPEFGLTCADLDGNDGAAAMARIGKKAAGAILDGREWREFPEPAREYS
jgi:protein gp37